MARREPLNLKAVLVVYNFLMVGLSAYMFYEVLFVLSYQPLHFEIEWVFFTPPLPPYLYMLMYSSSVST